MIPLFFNLIFLKNTGIIYKERGENMWYCKLHNYYPTKEQRETKCFKEVGNYNRTRRLQKCKHLIQLERKVLKDKE